MLNSPDATRFSRSLLAVVLSASACASPESESIPGPASADHHLHIRSQAGAEHFDRLGVALGELAEDADPSEPITAGEAIAALDAAGMEAGMVLSNAYMFGMPEVPVERERELVRAENAYVAEQVERYSDRLVGLCSVNPLRPYAIEEIERCAADTRIVGLKLHLANSDIDLRDDDQVASLAEVFRELDRLDLDVLVHMRTRDPNYGAEDADTFIDRVLSQAPGIDVQIAHMAGWGGYDDATDAALGAFVAAIEQERLDPSRITFGLGAVVFQPAAAGSDTTMAREVREANAKLARRIRQLGIERVVYATDWPAWPPTDDVTNGIAANMELIRSALPLSDEELDGIFANVGPIVRAVAG
jgi:predicted TIM-barrel fold metal-dependent hydrolase